MANTALVIVNKPGADVWKNAAGEELESTGCDGVPRQMLGESNGCALNPKTHPGYRTAPEQVTFKTVGFWGQVASPRANGEKRWFPAGWYSLAKGEPLPKFVPGVAVPAVQPLVMPENKPLPFRDRVQAPRPEERAARKPEPTRPPPKEGKPDRKVKAPAALIAAAKAAFAVTEINDAIDAFWDAMPERMKAETERSGVCNKGCRNPGMRYATPIDKARAILSNWDKLPAANIGGGLAGVVGNHLMDQLVWGKLHRGVDRARRRAGGTGWGQGLS